MSIYKACDIRGQFGKELLIEHARKLGRAVWQMKGRTTVLVGGDGRISTPPLLQALINSLLECGCDVIDLGRIATPQFYFARRMLGQDVGIFVTASHNPGGDNGFKFTLSPYPVTEDEMAQIARLMESSLELPAPDHPGAYRQVDLLPDYLAFVAQHSPDLRGLKVVVDCANGMASLTARQAWSATGAQVTLLLDAVDGRFPVHAPNPAEVKNLRLLQEQVRLQGADLGVAYDGDADRTVFVDECGQPINGDQAVVLFASLMLQDGPQTIIYDQKCSRVVPESIRALGGTAVMERSGHTYIKRAFLAHQAAYAGELSGHHFLQVCGGDDALIASLIFARMLKDSGQPLSKLAAAIPTYAITPDLRIPMAAHEIQGVIQQLEHALGSEAELSRHDGLRIEYPHGWGLIRPSVTEPLLTLRFEGVDAPALQRILLRVEEAAPLLRGKLAPAQ
jgi:phosphomannomutase / phosphoglucomutase